MPSAKSARVSERKKEMNQPVRTKAKGFVARTRKLVEAGDLEGALAAALTWSLSSWRTPPLRREWISKGAQPSEAVQRMLNNLEKEATV